MKQRKITGSFSNFERRYDPIEHTPYGESTILRDWREIPRNADVHFIWTVVDCDGVLILTPGLATVNYFARVLCRNPWGADEEFNTGYRY